jgi:hypothetical protein
MSPTHDPMVAGHPKPAFSNGGSVHNLFIAFLITPKRGFFIALDLSFY